MDGYSPLRNKLVAVSSCGRQIPPFSSATNAFERIYLLVPLETEPLSFTFPKHFGLISRQNTRQPYDEN
jgi:hypothetical protein